MIPALLLLQALVSTDVPADTLDAADFDCPPDSCEICTIDDDTPYDESTLFPWLFTDFGRLGAEKTLVDMATSKLGLPYRRGGKTPRGFDCSGFTGWVFSHVGIRLGASSRDQFLQGHKVDRQSDLKVGDLVFFSGRAGGKGRVGHVGMVIDNDPATSTVRFIHSTHRSGITVSRLDEPYYSNRYMGARRVL